MKKNTTTTKNAIVITTPNLTNAESLFNPMAATISGNAVRNAEAVINKTAGTVKFIRGKGFFGILGMLFTNAVYAVFTALTTAAALLGLMIKKIAIRVRIAYLVSANQSYLRDIQRRQRKIQRNETRIAELTVVNK